MSSPPLKTLIIFFFTKSLQTVNNTFNYNTRDKAAEAIVPHLL